MEVDSLCGKYVGREGRALAPFGKSLFRRQSRPNAALEGIQGPNSEIQSSSCVGRCSVSESMKEEEAGGGPY